MKKIIYYLLLLLLSMSAVGCAKDKELSDSDQTDETIDLTQYRLVYTYKGRSWSNPKKDHVSGSYVDFFSKTQAESFGSTFEYTVVGNKVSYTRNGITYRFDIDPKTKTVSNLSASGNYPAESERILEFQIQKLQPKNQTSTLVNSKFSGAYQSNQEAELRWYPITFKFSDKKFVKYGLIIGDNEPNPVHDLQYYADNSAFQVFTKNPYEVLNGIVIDDELYVQIRIPTSPEVNWGILKPKSN